MNEYSRVLPRDLFNEAKLLKNLGFLVLRIQNGTAPEVLSFEQTNTTEFEVCQDQSSGDLYVKNVTVRVASEPIYLYHPYNEKESLSLRFECGEFEGKVFETSKIFSEDFRALCTHYQDKQVENDE